MTPANEAVAPQHRQHRAEANSNLGAQKATKMLGDS